MRANSSSEYLLQPPWADNSSPRLTTISFDIFDTVVTRSSGAPEALYLWLGRRLAQKGVISCTPEQFARTRAICEKRVWLRAGGMDSSVLISDFYQELVDRLWLDAGLVPQLVEEELNLELQVLKSTEQGRNWIKSALDSGKSVGFISDTYFQEGFVARILSEHGLSQDTQFLFVSSSHSKSKASGKLFETVLKSLEIDGAEIFHIGDNAISDEQAPRSRGVTGHVAPRGRLNRYEQILNEARWESSGLAASLAGASRIARLTVKADLETEAAIRDVSAGVAAPILIGYILWLLHRASDQNIQKLYFTSRDGEVFHQIAAILIERMKLPIEVSYLYASRRSVNFAATFTLEHDDIAWIIRDFPSLTPTSFLERFHLRLEEVPEIQAVGLNPTEMIPPNRREELLNLIQLPRIRSLILEKAASVRALITDYLRQEGVLDGRKHGIVDFGGVGSQVRALYTIVRKSGCPGPTMFLLGIDREEPPPPPSRPADSLEWLSNTECYLYDHRRHKGIKRERGFGTLVQMFCGASHGSVRGFERRNGTVEAVVDEPVDQRMHEWGLPILRKTLETFSREMVLDEDLVDPRADIREVACRLIKLLWSSPTPAEARAWGAFPFEGAFADGNCPEALASAYSISSILQDVKLGRFPRLGWQHWYEGSLTLSPSYIREPLVMMEKTYRSLRRSPGNGFRNLENRVRRLLGKRVK